MGLSSPITAATLVHHAGPTPTSQAKYLSHFRANSAVRDLEAIRKSLTTSLPPTQQKWSLIGQSYGGFVAVTYLSLFPQGLREVFTMGGLPPVRLRSPDEVYTRTVAKVKQRNRAYYNKFPEDVARVKTILQYLSNEKEPVLLPSGGVLSPERFMQIGILFGTHGGLDKVHDAVLRAWNDLDTVGFLTRPTLAVIEGRDLRFDNHPIYAVLHEAIYCQGPGEKSNWAADRVVQANREFGVGARHSDPESEGEEVYFTGEMVFRQNLSDYGELRQLAPAAEILAQKDDWDELYDLEQLKRNQVPVYASTYVDDMFVDFGLAQETAGLINGCKTFVTNAMYHDAVSKKGEELMGKLFALKEDSID